MRRRLQVVVAMAVALVLVGCASTALLRTGDVETSVEEALSDQVGGTFTADCPSSVPAEAGGTFTCQVTDATDRATVTVTVTQSDDQGAFTWQVTAVPDPLPTP